MADKVTRLAVQVARQADRTLKVMEQRIALLEWETELLRNTLAHAADLLDRSARKTAKRGDVWKRANIRRIARIFAPSGTASTGKGP